MSDLSKLSTRRRERMADFLASAGEPPGWPPYLTRDEWAEAIEAVLAAVVVTKRKPPKRRELPGQIQSEEWG